MKQSRILLVDDDADLLEAVRIRLSAYGFDVYTASDGVEAARSVHMYTPDVIVLDIGMPHGDGHWVARQIKNDPVTESIPIIFLTARSAMKDFQRAHDTGVEKFITKPFQPEELTLAVEELLERQAFTARGVRLES